jgi:divalent metal cation (Fe/Co/Zn/Cd) transporter
MLTPDTASVEQAARAARISQAFRLEYATLAWMIVEAAVAIGSGLAAGSLLLTAFGIDSLIELASAVVLIWRLGVELRRGEMVAEGAERAAAQLGAALLFALALYVVVTAGWKLWTRQGADFSVPGLIVCLAAIPIMYFLSRQKLKLADALGSRALRADAVESLTCGWLALVVIGGLLAQFLIDAWWLDPLVSLAIVWFLIREGREAWTGDACCEADEHPNGQANSTAE